VLGVEQTTVDGSIIRTTAKTASEGQWRVGRELRRRLTESLEQAGITQQISASRMFIRPPSPTDLGVTEGPGGAGGTEGTGGTDSSGWTGGTGRAT